MKREGKENETRRKERNKYERKGKKRNREEEEREWRHRNPNKTIHKSNKAKGGGGDIKGCQKTDT